MVGTNGQAFATAVAKFLIQQGGGSAPGFELEADGIGVAGIAAGAADNAIQRQAFGQDASAVLPGNRWCRYRGLKRLWGTGLQAVTTKNTTGRFKTDLGKTAGAAEQELVIAGGDAVIATAA